jgi:hypothetical protein
VAGVQDALGSGRLGGLDGGTMRCRVGRARDYDYLGGALEGVGQGTRVAEVAAADPDAAGREVLGLIRVADADADPEALRTPNLSDAMFDAVVAAIATAGPRPQAPGPIPAANALRTEIPDLTMLSPGERHVLQEWLDRIVSAHPQPARG